MVFFRILASLVLAFVTGPALAQFQSGSIGDASGFSAQASGTYLGLVATRGRVMDQLGTNRYVQSRTAMVASTQLTTGIKVAFANFRNVGALGAGPLDSAIDASSNATVTASIEYPSGTCTQLKFGGNATGTIPYLVTSACSGAACGGLLWSDPASVAVPAGATFWVRQLYASTAASPHSPYLSGQNGVLGDAIEFSGTALTDKTASCAALTNAGSYMFPPLAVVAPTTKPSVIIIGASVTSGLNDSEASNTVPYDGKRGDIARSLAGSIPFLNLSSGGETAELFQSHAQGRMQLIPYASAYYISMGSNDLGGSNGATSNQTAAQVENRLRDNVVSLIPAGRKVFYTTLTPRNNLADSCTPHDWTAYTCQYDTSDTGHGGYPSILTFNADIRAGSLAREAGFVDASAVFGASLVSYPGLRWQVDPVSGFGCGSAGAWGTAAATTDGLHPKSAAVYAYGACALAHTSTPFPSP